MQCTCGLVNVLILSKMVDRFNIITIKILARFLLEIDRPILKLADGELGISGVVLTKKCKVEEPSGQMPRVITTVLTTQWCWPCGGFGNG